MGFDCSKCIDKCKAECCGVVPFEKSFYENNIDKIVTTPSKIFEHRNLDPFDNKVKDFIIPVTSSGDCCFLQEDYKCVVYDNRPHICKIYGDESQHHLSCHWQDKNGKERSKQERKYLDKLSKDKLENLLNN